MVIWVRYGRSPSYDTTNNPSQNRTQSNKHIATFFSSSTDSMHHPSCPTSKSAAYGRRKCGSKGTYARPHKLIALRSSLICVHLLDTIKLVAYLQYFPRASPKIYDSCSRIKYWRRSHHHGTIVRNRLGSRQIRVVVSPCLAVICTLGLPKYLSIETATTCAPIDTANSLDDPNLIVPATSPSTMTDTARRSPPLTPFRMIRIEDVVTAHLPRFGWSSIFLEAADEQRAWKETGFFAAFDLEVPRVVMLIS